MNRIATSLSLGAVLIILAVVPVRSVYADQWCSGLNVSVSTLGDYSLGYQRVEVRTNVNPAREIDTARYPLAVIDIEVEFEAKSEFKLGRPQHRAFISRHTANWGTFSKANQVLSPGPITSIRVVNAGCVGVTGRSG